jgi:hypothetical protein
MANPFDTGTVIFDGVTRTITVKSGSVDVDVQVDLYSDWKEFVKDGDNAKFLPAFRTVGGDPLVAGLTLGRYFFLTNGWQLRPQSGTADDVVLDGNIFHDDGIDVVETSGSDVQLWQNVVSSLTVISEVSSSAPAGLTGPQEARLNATYNATGDTTASVDEVITSQSFAAADHTEIITSQALADTERDTIITSQSLAQQDHATIILSQSLADTDLDTIITSQSLADSERDIIITSQSLIEQQVQTIIQSGSLTALQVNMLVKLYEIMGLDPAQPLVVTPLARTVSSSISQSISQTGDEVTVTRTV